MKKFFERLFCKHIPDKTKEVGFSTDVFGTYMGKIYKCTKCDGLVTETDPSYVYPEI